MNNGGFAFCQIGCVGNETAVVYNFYQQPSFIENEPQGGCRLNNRWIEIWFKRHDVPKFDSPLKSQKIDLLRIHQIY
jgi:hypothetical protein